MAFSMINFLKEDVRLVKYENRIYKLKILYEEEQKLANFVPKFSQKEAHHELEQVVKAVLCVIDKNQTLNIIQTDKFVVNVKTKPWGTSQKLGFKQDGVQVPSHPYMIILNVIVKDLDEGDVSIHDEIPVQNQTPKSISSKNLKNTSSVVNSNVRVSQKRLISTESNAKTVNKVTCPKQGREKGVLSTDADSHDGLSTQDICDLLDEARNLRELEKLESERQERKEKKAKEDAERFATKYAQRVVKETEKAKKLTKPKIDNIPQTSSPLKKNQNAIRNSDNLHKMSDSPLISKTRSSKKNPTESHRQSETDQRQIASPEINSGQQSSSESTDSASEGCEITDLGNRKRKLSESPPKLDPESEDFPEKRRKGRPRTLLLGQPSKLKLKERKTLIETRLSLKSKAVSNKDLRNQNHERQKIGKNVVESSDKSENKRLRLQIRKSPRIQHKCAEEKWLNKNNSSKLNNSGISVTELRSTRRDRHLIEQEELAEDMKLQQLAKSSPNHKQRTSTRHKRRSSTLWDFIVSPVKSIFSK